MLKKLLVSAVVAITLAASAAPGSAQYRYRPYGGYYGRPYGYAPRPYWNRPYYGGYYGPGVYGGVGGYGVYGYPNPSVYGYPGYGAYYGAPTIGIYGPSYY